MKSSNLKRKSELVQEVVIFKKVVKKKQMNNI